MAFPKEWPWEVKTLLHRSLWVPRGCPGHRGPCQPQEVPEKPTAGWQLSVPLSVPFAPQENVPREPLLGLGVGDIPPEP